MQYRLVALDLDGTAIDPGGVVRPAVRRAVSAVRERGVRVVVCTGRRFRTALPCVRALGLEDGPVVLHHGALVKDVASAATRARARFPDDLYRAAATGLAARGTPIVYVDGYPAYDLLTGPIDGAHPALRGYLAAYRSTHRRVEDALLPPAEGALVLALLDEAAKLAELERELEERLGPRASVVVHPTRYGSHILEVVPSHFSKWSALRGLADEWGIAPEEILAIGDQRNDVELVREAGLGVAMGNAVPELKAVAAHVTAGNEADGVAEALAHFVLGSGP